MQGSRGTAHVSHLRGRDHVRQHVLPAHAAPRVLAGVQGGALGADRRPEHGEGVPALVAEWVVEPDHASLELLTSSIVSSAPVVGLNVLVGPRVVQAPELGGGVQQLLDTVHQHLARISTLSTIYTIYTIYNQQYLQYPLFYTIYKILH